MGKCAGTKQTGYWKGYPCGAVGKYKRSEKWYCANHLPEVLAARGKPPATRVVRKET
jgi:hypothetical protein